MMKKLVSFLLTAVIALGFSVPVFAEAEPLPCYYKEITSAGSAVVHDLGGFLDDEKYVSLTAQVKSVVEESGVSVCVIMTNDNEDAIPQEKADSYYAAECGAGTNGVLLMIDGATGAYQITISGTCEYLFTPDRIPEVTESVERNFSGSVFDSATSFAGFVLYYSKLGYDLPEGMHKRKINDHYALLHDMDDSLTDTEEAILFAKLSETVILYDVNMCVVLVNEGEELSDDSQVAPFADDYYERECGKDSDGILLLLNNGTRYDWITAGGRCADIFGRYGSDDLFNTFYQYVIDNDLYNAAYYFSDAVDKELQGSVSISGTDTPSSEESTGSSDGKVAEGQYKKQISGHYAMLHDLDDTLSESDEKKLFDKLCEVTKNAGFSVCVLFSNDIGSPKTQRQAIDYADVYYERECGINTDGILLLINNDTQYDWISTSGKCINIFYDSKIDALFNTFYSYIEKGSYYQGAYTFADSVERVSRGENIGKGTSHGSTSYYSDFYLDPGLVIFFLIVIVVIELFFVLGVSDGYKLKPLKGAKGYMVNNTLQFTDKQDIFVRTYVTRHTVSSSSGGGGGHHSSSHHSSGGGHHGGGGRSR